MDIAMVTVLVLFGTLVGWLLHEAQDMIDEAREDRMEDQW
jgi:hypothetical protein